MCVEKPWSFEVPQKEGRRICSQVFFDLDGVFADFDAGWEDYLGSPPPRKKGAKEWAAFMAAGGFEKLPPMPWFHIMTELLREFPSAYILTGTPRPPFSEDASTQKKSWCRDYLGISPERVLTCMSYDKPRYAEAVREQDVIPILVDDRKSAREGWEASGGLFIHYPSEVRPLESSVARSLRGDIMLFVRFAQVWLNMLPPSYDGVFFGERERYLPLLPMLWQKMVHSHNNNGQIINVLVGSNVWAKVKLLNNLLRHCEEIVGPDVL